MEYTIELRLQVHSFLCKYTYLLSNIIRVMNKCYVSVIEGTYHLGIISVKLYGCFLLCDFTHVVLRTCSLN